MHKLFLSIALAVLLVGTVALSPADAHWRRGWAYYYSYPGYRYYYTPDYGAYCAHAPGYHYYRPGYYYYPRWRPYRWWWR